ncbi:chemotaxis protein CheX [Azospirillum agricola]|uniref:chemotaxis protein CheX n=1 Tax=Azospirillum agricola TaxID=1720247 RepID=UPI000A0F3A3E|nr:chemotaxis protein CheX [Azospirillum agricola]SMH48545.1 CheC, inhibitor of MCP methylation [Azospirillum lipoferum]
MVELTDLERDALTELVNMGVGRAATHLSRMVSDQVLLSVPSVDIVSRDAATEFLTTRERSGLVAVEQQFQGSFAGRALLIFPEANSLELARAVLGSELTLAEIVDLEQDALAEIGNIILNGCLVVIANTLKDRLSISLPAVLRGSGGNILQDKNGTSDELVLFLYIDFSIRSRSIRGYIALLMGVSSLESLKLLIHGFIDGIAAPAPSVEASRNQHGADPL